MIRKLILEAPMSGEQAAAWVTDSEVAVARAFGSEQRRSEYLGWRAVVRRELGVDAQIAYNALGAPIVTNREVHLSVAHCRGRIAVCISDCRCAVDVEPEGRDFSRAASRYLTAAERELSSDPLLSALVWCAKEALYKYAGREGLELLDDLCIERIDIPAGRITGRICGEEPIELAIFREEGFVGAYIL